MPRSVSFVTLVVALGVTIAASAGEAETRRFALPNLDMLELTVPADWQETVDQPPGGGPPIIQFRPHTGAGFEVYLTPEWTGPSPGRILDAESLHQQVRDAAERFAPQPAEQEPPLRRLQGADGVGFYFMASDDTPDTGGFRHLCQGVLQAGGLLLRFEVLTNDDQESVVAAALAMLQDARHLATGADQR